jgi:hypothetical protein
MNDFAVNLLYAAILNYICYLAYAIHLSVTSHGGLFCTSIDTAGTSCGISAFLNATAGQLFFLEAILIGSPLLVTALCLTLIQWGVRRVRT